MSKKAQLAVIDSMMAIAIFFLLFISIIFIWNNYTTRLNNKIDLNQMQIKTFQITNNLVKNPGIPTAWEFNTTNLEHIGLIKKDRVLSTKKLNVFTNLSYNTIRSIFKIDHYDYNFYFKLRNISLEKEIITTKGLEPEDKTTAINIQRLVTYEGKEAILQFSLWK